MQNKIYDGGPACSICGVDATIKQGNQLLCDQHYRFGQMRGKTQKHLQAVFKHKCEEMEGIKQ